jgi:uncharacterized protein
MVSAALNSCLYVGSVRHRRFAPKPHAFRYGLFMTLLDLDELELVFRGRWLWSTRRPTVAWFRRKDYFDGSDAPLAEAVRTLVRTRTGKALGGPVRMLTHLRLFGYCFNPITLYFCYGADAQQVEALVAEVTNTPWGERRLYVLSSQAEGSSAESGGPRKLHYRFEKSLHVSPFMEMDYLYDLRLTEPGATLAVHLENLRLIPSSEPGAEPGEKVHDATLTLERREISSGALAGALAAYPFLTLRLIAAIYVQALKLWWKGIPFVSHPVGTPRTTGL